MLLFAVLIYAAGPDTLIREILDSGADVNGYSKDFSSEYGPEINEIWCLTPLQAAASCGSEGLVVDLLRRGADINAPAKGCFGKTALQYICNWRPKTSEERSRKTRIIQHLLVHGADVNGAAAELRGGTAMQITATHGDLKLAALLLGYGADVNASPSSRQGFVALDGAVYWGRLDMVQLLLNAGALSINGGASGYEGAIALAHDRCMFPIADLIKDHADKAGRMW